LVLAGLVLSVLMIGCAWEASLPDAGPKDSGNGGDLGPAYPPPPYGAGYGDTAENIAIERVSCQGDIGSGRPWKLEEFLGAKATLITIHTGWCIFCKEQSKTMEADLARFRERGLEVILIMTEDPSGSTNRQKLLDYTCKYRKDYGLTFALAIDPGAAASGQFFNATPLNMLLDRNMEIRYKVMGLLPESDTMNGNIEGLLNE
jgi:peroxiredoxin